MHLSDIDLKLLRVFHAVVEASGFSTAQGLLNVSPSTISAHMSQLEARVGFRLCERGRSGFRLTPKGERFHRHILEFFAAVQGLEANARALSGQVTGALRLGIVDNLVTDPDCPLHAALADSLDDRGRSVRISLEVLTPKELEKGLLESQLDLGIGIFHQRREGLDYRPLYRERDVLVCGRHHPLAEVTDPHALAAALPSVRKVARGFMQRQEFPFVTAAESDSIVTVDTVEAAAFLILNGPLIGFLPRHYAQRWLDNGALIALRPDKFVHYSTLSLVTAAGKRNASPVVAAFIERLATDNRGASDTWYAPA